MKYASIRELIDLCTDQDDIIYELREENARLREVLEDIIDSGNESYMLSKAKKALEKSE